LNRVSNNSQGDGGHSCPRCSSTATASRRQLFYRLMEERSLPLKFGWYNLSLPRACPPKSVLVVSLLAAMWPATLLWYLGYYSFRQGIIAGGLVLLACLGFDLLSTYPRYKTWRSEWLCGDCRSVFTAYALETRRNALQLI
jgi:hypothetical protein